jgi:hypothetical protein
MEKIEEMYHQGVSVKFNSSKISFIELPIGVEKSKLLKERKLIPIF